MSVRYRDGIEVGLSTGEVVVADAGSPDGDVALLSHAHGDHLYDGVPGETVCSALTADLAATRRSDLPAPVRVEDDRIEQVPAGHVPGSRVSVVADPDGTRYCYTGDVSTHDGVLGPGFDPSTVDADVLITEATYGRPDYVFPDRADEEAALVDWLDDVDAPALLFGYALGRAQALVALANRSERSRVLTTDAVLALNEVIATARERGTASAVAPDAALDATRFDTDDGLGPDDVAVLPAGLNNTGWVDALRDRTGALTVGASGWAVDDAYRFRGDYDETFVLSDHCDFEELVGLVETVDPDRVYTQHGAGDELATHLTTLGYDARTIKPNQTSLGDF
jgi:putative mRNA 3-end processing factor